MTIAPLDQFMNPTLFMPLPVLSVGLSKLSLYGIISSLLTISFFIIPFLNRISLAGTRWSVTVETLYFSVSSILKDQIGGNGFTEYLPLAICLFTFVLFANLVSNIPYSFGFTTSVIVCLSISIIIFIGVTIIGIYIHKIHWFSFFVPAGSPLALVPLLVLIEFISYIARAFSLGIRLLANLTAGHILLAVLSAMIWNILTTNIVYFIVGLIPFAIFTGLFALELAVSVIQAYVLTLLFSSYLNDAINLH